MLSSFLERYIHILYPGRYDMWVLVIPFENVWQSYDGEIFSPLHSYYRIRRASWFDPMV